MKICAPLIPSASTTTPACGRSSVIPKTRTSPSPTVRTSTWCGASATSNPKNPEPGLRRARRDAAGVRAVDEHVEAATARLLPVVELHAREARRDLRPGARPGASARDADPEQPEAAVPARARVLEARLLGLELVGHVAAHAVLHVRLPRPADRDEPAAAVAEARLKVMAEGSRAHVARGVRVAVLQDAHVVVSATVLEAREPLEEVSEAVGTVEMADRSADESGCALATPLGFAVAVRLTAAAVVGTVLGTGGLARRGADGSVEASLDARRERDVRRRPVDLRGRALSASKRGARAERRHFAKRTAYRIVARREEATQIACQPRRLCR